MRRQLRCGLLPIKFPCWTRIFESGWVDAPPYFKRAFGFGTAVEIKSLESERGANKQVLPARLPYG